MAGTAEDRGPGAQTEEARARRAERVAAMRRAEQRKERGSKLALIAAVVVVALVAVGAVVAVIANQPDPPSLAAVQSYEYSGGEHTDQPVQYAENPPVGGQHDGVWQNCGIYDEPVRSENAVHSLEHGAVWITYSPDLPAEQVERLREFAQGESHVLLSPHPGLPSPVVASAWNHQLQLDDAGDPRLPAFLAEYVQGSQTPEPGAACSGGIGTPTA